MHAGFQPLAHSIRAQRALINFLRAQDVNRGILNGQARDAELATDAVILIKIHNAVGVLHNCTIGWTRCQASRIGAMHALIFSHQPIESFRLRAGVR